MPHPKFIGPAFRLVRTLDSVLDQGHRRIPVRLELFQNPENPRQFRYRAWVLEWFKLQTQYHDEPLPHEAWTTFCLPNFGAGDYFEASDLDAAERKFFEDFEKQPSEGRGQA
jgi:hypothetical protein